MESIGTGAGLAAMGFWLFIAIIIATSVWDSIRKRDAQHETLRRAIESGQPIDDALADRLLAVSSDSRKLARDLKVGGIIVLFLAWWFVLRPSAGSVLVEVDIGMQRVGVAP